MNSPYQSKQSSPSTPKYLGVFILLVFVFMLGLNIGMNQAAKGGNAVGTVRDSDGQSEIVNMDLFWEAWNVMSANYVDPHKLDTQEMIYGSIRGMVESLEDPYSAFLTPKENKDFQNSLSGIFGGIGAELTFRNDKLTVVSPLKDSPANRMGVQPEDLILAIDEESTEGMTLEEAATKIRGVEGTEVTLSLSRDDLDEPFDLTIKREVIHVNSVEWEMLEEGIAWMELNMFGDETKKEFSKAISDILAEGPDGFILDLRYNGGGLLDGAIDIASEFLDNNALIVSIKARNPEEDEVLYADGQGRMTHLPMVILINGGSASASEIVSGALQDHKRAIIIGEPSFGKATVQSVENLVGGSSLRITRARWFTPNNQIVEEEGIMPDFIVERTEEDFDADIDPPLNAAIEYLKTGSVPETFFSESDSENSEEE